MVFFFAFLLLAFCSGYSLGQSVTLFESVDRVVLSNGFVRLEVNKINPSVDRLYASNTGSLGPASSPVPSSFNNLFANRDDPNNSASLDRQGIVFEIDLLDQNKNFIEKASTDKSLAQAISLTIDQNTDEMAQITIKNISAASQSAITSTWTLSLQANQFFFNFNSNIQFNNNNNNDSGSGLVSIRTSIFMSPPSINGLFTRGIVQMMNNDNKYFSASNSQDFQANIPFAIYCLGNQKGSVYMQPLSIPSPFNSNTFTIMGWEKLSGIQIIHLGNSSFLDEWNDNPWVNAPVIPLESIDKSKDFSFESRLSANLHDFPILHVPNTINSTTSDYNPQLYDDLRSLSTSIYGGSAGSLVTYLVPHVGSPTIAFPNHAYSPLYSFYDPDNWLTVLALSYSGLGYLQEQARLMLETHVSKVLPSGQLPHHFDGDASNPIYVAISGATQTGPNVFWSLAALCYARNSGNTQWLKNNIQSIQLVVGFLENMVDKEVGLLKAEGPLYIDTFIRNNFTTDSNAMFVILLRELATAEEYIGDSINATKHINLANSISSIVIDQLWSTSDHDHFVTQLNIDPSSGAKTQRDFVDYDSNLIAAVALLNDNNNETHISMRTSLLNRIDSGKCTRTGRATFVSEKYYDASNTYNGNTGDSDITMGRIAYFDAWAHYIHGDNNNINSTNIVLNQILQPLVNDLFKSTYLYERYTCDGTPTHNPYYHEYSELIVMLLREIVYGININFNSLSINPAYRNNFNYNVGNVYVLYSADNTNKNNHIEFNIVGDGESKQVIIYNLLANNDFDIKMNGINYLKAQSDKSGVLSFQAKISNEFTYQINSL